MRVLLAGGGTAGHCNPALAIAGIIKSKNPAAEILFVGNAGSIEEKLVGREMTVGILNGKPLIISKPFIST